MSIENNSETTVKVISFSGEKSDWRMWSKRFTALATAKGYKDVLLGLETVPSESTTINTSTDNEKQLQRAKKANEKAYADLLLACTDPSSFRVIEAACTTDLPSGSANEAWKGLIDLYKPKDQTTQVEVLGDFQKLHLADNEKPMNYFSPAEYLRRRLKAVSYDLTDNQIIAHFITTIPTVYKDYLLIFNQLMKDIRNTFNFKRIKGFINNSI